MSADVLTPRKLVAPGLQDFIQPSQFVAAREEAAPLERSSPSLTSLATLHPSGEWSRPLISEPEVGYKRLFFSLKLKKLLLECI